ncbi:carcinoembryonic antigen-related cell adhesion molecule 5-like isoform X1 [Heterodontus francisci]|uniref:carcinoembryonic antigen-related cell adhesion molecule 5-like isoform X1 n=1 Tax=Heterodontus francisci TaxID=7792 RepID=UPI00355C9171
MVRLSLTAVAVCLLISVAVSQDFTILIENSRINVTVGGDVLFSVKPSAAVKNGNWVFGVKSIGTWIGTGVSLTNEYESRAEIFPTNGSLLLKSVTDSDSGEYTVTMVPNTGSQTTASITLRVLAESQDFTILIENSRINVTVGDDAFFSVKPSAAVKNGNWMFGVNSIGVWIGTGVSLSDEYESRAEIFPTNGSLLLKSVTDSDSGEYTVTMVPNTGSQTTASITLRVLAESQDFTILIENSRINVTVGGDALFSVKPSAAVKNGNWMFGVKSIGTWIGTGVSLSNEYESRAEIFPTNGSLLLKSVTDSDSGEYTVTMVPNTGSQTTASITLRVLESIIKPVVISNNTHPVERNDTVTLTCSASGPVDSYNWLKGNKIINPGGRIGLSGDNKTLTISGVLRYDGGFICRAYSAIDERRSEPYYLNVSYGPESLDISINPQLSIYILGSNVNFSCSAISKPPSEFQWYLNGTSLLQNGPQLIISDISLSNTGNYTCEAFNNATKRYSMTTRDIVVVEPVSKPTISSNDTNPVEYNDTVALTCNASGTAVSYQWLNDNKTITPDDRIDLSDDNSTLTISGVLRSDEEFTCHVSNMFSENTSDPYLLNVNYGPESLNISINPQLAFYILGSNVNFSCSAVSNPASEFLWYLNGTSLQQNGPQLIIPDISLNNTGNYTCEVFNNATKRSSVTTTDMVVVEPVSKPIITANATNPVEHNDTVALTCFASGTEVSYQWLKDNSTIIPDNRFGLSDDNRTLTISGVLRTDGGFTCYAFNFINGMTSDLYHLNVSYGPERLNISINPDLPAYITGRTVTFSCSVDSSPPAELEWYLNGISLQQKGQQLIITSITLNDSGNYTCQAFNNLTKRYSASTKQIAVIERVSNVTVSSNNSKPIENIDTILLTCHASGFVQLWTWYKDNQAIWDNDRILTSPDNVTLTIVSVNRNDSGRYKCNASNDFSSDSGDTILLINYGPENVIIAPPGPIWAELGKPLEFHCSAPSVPAGAYEWYIGTRLLKTGQTYNIASISSDHAGNYTCQVNNVITLKNSNATVQVTVQDPILKEPTLSVGAIIGIVIAVVAVIVIIGISIWLIKRKTSRAKGGSQQNEIKMASPGNTAPSSQTEYAAVERKQPYIQKPVQSSNGTSTDTTKPTNPDVVYAQPSIFQQGPKAPNATAVDKTDYAELKFR